MKYKISTLYCRGILIAFLHQFSQEGLRIVREAVR